MRKKEGIFIILILQMRKHFKKFLFYLFLTVLGLHFCEGFLEFWGVGATLSISRLLTVVTSLVVVQWL